MRVASSALSMAASVSVRFGARPGARERRWRVARRRYRGRAALPVGFLDLRGELSRAVQVDADADHDRRRLRRVPGRLDQDAGELAVVDQHVVRPLQRKPRRCRQRQRVHGVEHAGADGETQSGEPFDRPLQARTRSKRAARCPVAQPTDARAGRAPPSASTRPARAARSRSPATGRAGVPSCAPSGRHWWTRFRRRSRLTSRALAARRAS